ncbi:hypothetical protein BH20VER1_BH20VER1_21990 [soil metagenome]
MQLDDAEVSAPQPEAAGPLAGHGLDAGHGVGVLREFSELAHELCLDPPVHALEVARRTKAARSPLCQSRLASRRSAMASASRSRASASTSSQNCAHGMMTSSGSPRGPSARPSNLVPRRLIVGGGYFFSSVKSCRASGLELGISLDLPAALRAAMRAGLGIWDLMSAAAHTVCAALSWCYWGPTPFPHAFPSPTAK